MNPRKRSTAILLMVHLIIASLFTPAFAQVKTSEVRAEIAKVGGAERYIARLADAAAHKLPLTINNNVEMLSAVAVGNRITFLSRMTQMDQRFVTDAAALRKANLNYSACHASVLQTLIEEYKTELVYVAIDKNGRHLFEYRINQATCSEQ